MTAPDLDPRHVDPAHILAVCAGASAGRARGNILLAQGQEAARLYLPARSSGRAVQAALSQVGYQVSPIGNGSRGRYLIVHGWDENRLEARLTAMRGVLNQLAEDPRSTAAAVIGRFRELPEEKQAVSSNREVIRQGAQQLRAWISARSGIHAPHDPRIQPADASCARRLRMTWQLEGTIDDFAFRHLRVAAHALNCYRLLRPVMSADEAQDTAIRQASIMFHVSPPAAQDTSPLLRDAGPATSPPPGRPFPQSPDSPRSRSTREFPSLAGPGVAASRPPTRSDARPRGRTFPAGPAGRHPR